MHLQDCISDNLSGAIGKQEMSSCPRERYTRGLHCHIVFVMQYQALQHHATSHNTVNKTFFSGFVGCFGSFWLVLLVVLGGFSCFWLVTTNVLHKHSLCKWKLRWWKSKSAYTLFCFIRILFFRPRLNILIFLPIFG